MTVLRSGAATDVGRVRSNNQDSHLVRDGELFAVADGMGGHQGGEVASATALEILARAYDEASTATLVRAVRSANQAVFDKASADPDLKGMGTTLTALADVATPEGQKLAIVNVGDSRLYRFRRSGLEQLTEDHSLVASLFRQGRITEEEMENHPQRNILTRALGIDEAVAVDSWEVEPVAGDRFLICSDGLFNEVEENRMVSTLSRFDEPTEAAQELVRLANEGGGRDNITAVVVDVLSLDDTAAVPVVEDDPDDTSEHDIVPPAVPVDPVLAAEADPGDDGDEDDEPKSRRFTWRVAVFVLALLLLIAAVVGALGWYARNTFFVTFEDDQVVVFKGRPGGFLWFDPTLELTSDLTRDDVPASSVAALEDGVDQSTLADAERYLANLEDQVAQEEESTPSTTTTVPTTTTKPERQGGGGGGNNTGGTATNGTG